jgi:hypothetical protein
MNLISKRFAINTISIWEVIDMQISKISRGDSALYEKLKGAEVRATQGNSSVGYGWRPVCRGVYLGNECKPSEAAALIYGKKWLAELGQKVARLQAPKRLKAASQKRGRTNVPPSTK